MAEQGVHVDRWLGLGVEQLLDGRLVPFGHARLELVAACAEAGTSHQVSHQRNVLLVCHTPAPLVVTRPHCCRSTCSPFPSGLRAAGPGLVGPAASSTDLTHPMDRQVVRRDDVTPLREEAQVQLSRSSQEQVDHSTASLADEMIVWAGLWIESGALFVQEECPDLTLCDETVKVAIHGGETDPGQLLVNPSVDLVGERVRVITLESGEHLLQLTCSVLAG